MSRTVAVWRDVKFTDSQWRTVSLGGGPKYKIVANAGGWYAENESGKELSNPPKWVGLYAQKMLSEVQK